MEHYKISEEQAQHLVESKFLRHLIYTLEIHKLISAQQNGERNSKFNPALKYSHVH